jgi:hypothetical protein
LYFYIAVLVREIAVSSSTHAWKRGRFCRAKRTPFENSL